MQEEYRRILDTNYEVSNLGHVRRIQTDYYKSQPLVLKTWLNNAGYEMVALSHRCNITRCTVHRLVATAFLPNPNNLPEVNHIDGNKRNNAVSNLEWVSSSQNKKHAIENGLFHKRTDEENKRLAKTRFKTIFVYKNEDLAGVFVNAKETAEYIGCAVNSIYTSISKHRNLFGYTLSHERRCND